MYGYHICIVTPRMRTTTLHYFHTRMGVMEYATVRSIHAIHGLAYGGALSAVQLFGRLAVVETHTLWYFGHHCCLVVGSDVLGI